MWMHFYCAASFLFLCEIKKNVVHIPKQQIPHVYSAVGRVKLLVGMC